MKSIFLLLLVLLSNAASAQVQNTPVTDAKEIIGCWERVDFSDEAKKMMNEIEPWPIRYQWFCFESDGTLSTYASSKPANLTAAQLRDLLKSLPKTFSYSVLPLAASIIFPKKIAFIISFVPPSQKPRRLGLSAILITLPAPKVFTITAALFFMMAAFALLM